MARFFVRHAGLEREVALPAFQLSWVTEAQALRRLVVQTYIDAPARGRREDEYEVVRREAGRESVLDSGSIEQAYLALDSGDCLDLLLAYVDRQVAGDLDRLSELSEEVKHLLHSRKG